MSVKLLVIVTKYEKPSSPSYRETVNTTMQVIEFDNITEANIAYRQITRKQVDGLTCIELYYK